MNRDLIQKELSKLQRDLHKLEAIYFLLLTMEGTELFDYRMKIFSILESYKSKAFTVYNFYNKELSAPRHYKEIDIKFNDTDLTVQYDDEYQIEAIYVGTEDITQLLSHDEVEKLIEEIIKEENK